MKRFVECINPSSYLDERVYVQYGECLFCEVRFVVDDKSAFPQEYCSQECNDEHHLIQRYVLEGE